MFIKIRNNLDTQVQSAFLASNLAASGTTMYVKNIAGGSANWALQLGKSGEELAEITTISGNPSGTTINTGGTIKYAHPTDTPVYFIKYDQVVFERSTSGTAGSPLVIGTVNITPDSPYTQFEDTTGATTYAYKTYFRNSITNEFSSESDWITPSGFTSYSLAKIRDRIKRKLTSSNYIQSDDVINDWINEWLEKMTNAAIDVNRDYLLGQESISFASQQEFGTVTSTDFKELRKMSIVTASGTATAVRMNITDFRADQVFTESLPQYYWKGDTIFGRKPIDNAATIVLDYYKTPPNLVNDTDTLPQSMWNYTKSFVDYGYAQACYLDQKDEKGNTFIGIANGELAEFKTQIAPRWKSGTQYVTIVSPLSSDDDFQLI